MTKEQIIANRYNEKGHRIVWNKEEKKAIAKMSEEEIDELFAYIVKEDEKRSLTRSFFNEPHICIGPPWGPQGNKESKIINIFCGVILIGGVFYRGIVKFKSFICSKFFY